MSDPSKRGSYREVTISAILFAIVIGVVMNAAITYAGLKIGFTIGGSAIAAVLGFGVLRGLLRKGTILETNIAQTAASAINTSNSGIIFTVPVLFLLGYPLSASAPEFWLITLAAMGGAILGTAFIIPLRKQMIEIDRLRFPSGTGVAAILKSPGAGAAKSLVLVAGILISALIYLPVALPGIKSPAPVGELQKLFEREKISWADVQRTQAIDSWITAQQAPGAVIARGAIAAELEDVRKEIASMEECDRRRALREKEQAIEARLDGAPVDGPYSDALALAVYRAERGERSWESLKSLELGWAAKPLWGYSDLGWRFRAKADTDKPPVDLDGDGTPDQPLVRQVDYDHNGRADLVLDDEFFRFGRLIGLPDEMELIFAIAPFALGAGFITGRAGLLVLAGGILAYLFLTPVAFNQGWFPMSVRAHEAPTYAFQAFNRPLGIGLLLGGALMGVAMSVPAIRAAIKSMIAAGKTKVGGSDEMGIKSVVVAIIGAFILFFIAADYIGNRPFNRECPITQQEVCDTAPTSQFNGYTIAFASAEAHAQWEAIPEAEKDDFLESRHAKPGWFASLPGHVRAGLIALVAGVWIWFAGIIIAQCTGMTDWSPISGMALLTVVLVMLLAGTGAVVGAVLIGAALCVAITLAADMMADLRTGHLVGASPKRQQIIELSVVAIGPLIAMLVVLVIAEANRKSFGVPLGPGTPTSAPQAQALQAVITGVQGGEMPYALYGFGALLGGLLGLGAFSGLGVLVGLSMYLPFYYIATYGVGCLINMVLAKVKGRRWAEEWGVPFAAGLIVGESILALIINMYVLATG